MRKLVLLAITSLLVPAVNAGEDMWTMDNLPRGAMQHELGFSPDGC